jgi:hypothetical protein
MMVRLNFFEEMTRHYASFFSEEIMRDLIFFWRNKGAQHSFWRNDEALHFFSWRNKDTLLSEAQSWRASLFPQTKMKCLIISPEKNQVHHYSFKKKWVFFFWINNDVLYLVRQKYWNHATWRKKHASLIISSDRMKCCIISSETNQAHHYFFIKKSIFFWRIKQALQPCFLRKPGLLISSEKNQVPCHFFRNESRVSLFLQTKLRTSLFLQKKISKNWGGALALLHQKAWYHPYFLRKKIKCLIISSEKNESPHHFFRKIKRIIISSDFFLKK